MRQVFLDKGTIVIKEVCQPLLDDYSVLVSVHYSYISSGTESAAIAQARQNAIFTSLPKKIERVLSTISLRGISGMTSLMKGKLNKELQTLGYSCSGHVIAVGKKVKSFHTGDLVACAGAGFSNHADIICVPEHLVVRVHKESYLKAASLTTLGAIAIHGLRRAQVQLGECVCVWGLGLIGQLTVQLARCAGCSVIGIDILEERLELAQQFGAQTVYNANDIDIIKDIVFSTNQYGVDTTIIAAASQNDSIIQQALQITRKKGKVVIVGDINMHLERHPIYSKEIDFLVACSYGPGHHDQLYEQKGQDYPYPYVRWTENRNMKAFVDLLEHNRLTLDPLLTNELFLEKIAQGYEQILQKKKLGIVISYEKHTKATSTEECKSTQPAFIPARRETTSVGIVGIGGFAKVTLLPLIAKLHNVKINAVVDPDITRSLMAARSFNASKALINDHDLFNDDLVDVVVITSSHKYHCEQALRALHNGKAVFMERPMATDLEQLAELKKYLCTHNNAPLCINYHRPFSPFIQQIKTVLNNRKSPLVAQYRINAMPLANDHWMQYEAGAGRIIAESCHIIDLFCNLTDSKPIALSVETIHSSRDTIFPTDNFSVLLHFQDGSLCTMIHTSLGHHHMSKERMELFFDGKSIIMRDFTKLTGYGLPSSFSTMVKTPNQGHGTLVNKFFEQVKQPDFKPPIAIDQLLLVSEISLLIDKLACEGGGQSPC